MSDVQAYILGDGSIIGAAELEAFAKAAPAAPGAKRLKDDPFKYRVDDVVEPPENLAQLARFLETNTEHYRCVKAKATDVCGAYAIVPRDPDKTADEGDKARLEAWLGACNPRLTFEEVLERVWTDYEAVGNGYLEVIRSVDGSTVAGVEHLPAVTVRARKDGNGYLQRRGTAKVFFKDFGDARPIRADDGKLAEGGTPAEGERANEVLAFQNYHPRSDYYGLPDVLPALGAMVGNLQARDYNLAFFENNAIPQYAVLVQGGDLDGATKRVIADYFREHIKGQAHKTLVIPIPDERTKVTLVPLGAKVSDGHFTIYRKDNRDEVVRAHGVPPARIGIIESGNLGGGTGESQTATYKDAIVEPRQNRLERRINDKLIRDGLGITGWIIKFVDIDTEDTDRNSQIAERMVKAGLWKPAEGRHFVGQFTDDDYEGGDQAFMVLGSELVFMAHLAEKAEASKRALEALPAQAPPPVPGDGNPDPGAPAYSARNTDTPPADVKEVA